jgi:hypothetical protein
MTLSLEELHAVRAKMLKQEAALWEQSAKHEELERAAEWAEADLKNSRYATTAAIENHFASGGVGPLPGLDSMGLARLQENAILARNASRMADGERRNIDQQAEELVKELDQNRIAIESHGGNLRRTG